MSIKTISETYLADTYSRNLVLTEGLGSEVWDENGKRYIDFAAGIAVNVFGYSDTEWADSVSRQAYTLSHTSNLYHTEPAALLAEELVKRTGMKRAFLCNSGLEANECAMKAARKYSYDKYGAERYGVVTLKNSFHGRSFATLTATGQPSMHGAFEPLLQGFDYAEPNDIDDLKAKLDDRVCAFLFELVQGESGVNPLDADYVREAAKICKEKDILLIVDEVQTGIGRTGTLFAYEQYGFEPDLVTAAKGLGGGLPIGACLFGKNVESVFSKGDHGSTFGGNPVVCAGALNVLKRIDDRLLSAVKEKGEHLKEELLKCSKVKSVTGLGLMLGAEVEGDAKEYVKLAEEKGLLLITAKSKLRFLPALNISDVILDSGILILKEILK